MLRGTPYHSRTEPLCQSQEWRRWSGYMVASKYELNFDREYHAIRNSAALIDVSPLYKYLVHGRDALRLVNRIFTRDFSRCRNNQVMYTTWCDETGKVIEDGTVARLDAETFRITAAEPNLRWFQDNARRLDVQVSDISDQLAALSVQGPLSRQILQLTAEDDVGPLRYFRMKTTAIGGRQVSITRTGFTGDLGYEIWSKPDDAPAIWDALMAVGRDYALIPAGMLALDVTRIEAGLLLVDVDYTPSTHAKIEAQKSSPFELNLGWTVDLGKPGYFVGRRALAVEQRQGPAWHTVGLHINWDSLEKAYAQAGLPAQVPSIAWRTSVPLYSWDGKQREVGYATSGCFSPLLKRYIALASVRSDLVHPGAPVAIEVTVEHMRRRAMAHVVRTPFYDPAHKKANLPGRSR